jgi:hypothetical protein
MVISRAKRAAGRAEQQEQHRALAALVVQQRAERPKDWTPAPAPAKGPVRRRRHGGRAGRGRPFGR